MVKSRRNPNKDKSDSLLMTPSPTAENGNPIEPAATEPEDFVCFYDEDCDKLLTELNEIPPEDEDFVLVTRRPHTHDSPQTVSSRGQGSNQGGSFKELPTTSRDHLHTDSSSTPKKQSPAFTRLRGERRTSESDPDYDNIEDGENDTPSEKSFDGSYSVIKPKPRKPKSQTPSGPKAANACTDEYSSVPKLDGEATYDHLDKAAENESSKEDGSLPLSEENGGPRAQNSATDPLYQDLNMSSGSPDKKKTHTYANVNVSSELSNSMLHHDDSGISPGGNVQFRPENRSISWSNIRLPTTSEYYRRTGLNQSLSRIKRSYGADPNTAPIEIDQMDALLERNAKHVSFIKELLREGKMGEFFKILLRAVKGNLRNTVNHMLAALRDEGIDPCADSFREARYSGTILHAAILYRRDRIAIDIMTAFPKLVAMLYTSDEFRNQTCFHSAAAIGNVTLLRNMTHLIESPQERAEILNTVADGTHFKTNPEESTCLSAAALTGQFDLIDILVREGAELDLRGPGGNTLLHFVVSMSVRHPEPSIYQNLVEYLFYISGSWWSISKRGGILTTSSEAEAEEMKVEAFRYLLRLTNSAGHTPVTLAVSLSSPLAKYILSFEPVNKLPHTKFGVVSRATYDVTDVVSWHPGMKSRVGSYNTQSVLHVIAHTPHISKMAAASDLTSTEPVKTIIDMKWSVYKYIYYLWLFGHCIYMSGVSAVAGHIRDESEQTPGSTNSYVSPANLQNISNQTTASEQPTGKTPMGSFVILLLFPVLYIAFEFVDVIYTLYRSFGYRLTRKSLMAGKFPNIFVYAATAWTITGNGPYRVLLFSHAWIMIAWFIMACTGHQYKQIAMSLALITGWIFCVFFTRAFRSIGRVSVMIQKMLFEDFAYFCAIFVIILVAFTTGVYVVLPAGQTFRGTLEGMTTVVTGTGDGIDADTSIFMVYTPLLLVVYGLFTTILMINLLIAMMNTSYDVIKDSKSHICRNQQVSIFLMLERRLFWFTWLCKKSQHLAWYTPGSRMRLKLGIYSNPKRVLIDIAEHIAYVKMLSAIQVEKGDPKMRGTP